MMRVRIELADIPGALAGLTTALASLSVDVAAIDVLEVDGRRVVDEMLLRLPTRVTTQEVVDVLRVAGADVLSMGEAQLGGDPAVAAFDLARGVITSPGVADAPGRALARVAYADDGALIDIAEATRFPLAQRALSLGTPTSGPAGPEASPLAMSTGWVLWVAPQVEDVQRLAVVGRRLNVRFAATEAARLRAFVTMLEEVRRVWV